MIDVTVSYTSLKLLKTIEKNASSFCQELMEKYNSGNRSNLQLPIQRSKIMDILSCRGRKHMGYQEIILGAHYGAVCPEHEYGCKNRKFQ